MAAPSSFPRMTRRTRSSCAQQRFCTLYGPGTYIQFCPETDLHLISDTATGQKKIQTSNCYKLKTCELNCFHWEKNFVGNIKSEVADRYLKFAEETKFQLTQVNWKSSLSSTTPIHPWLENFSASQPRSCWRMGKKETTGTSQALTAYSSALSAYLDSRELLTYYMCSFQLLCLHIKSLERPQDRVFTAI